MAVVNVLRRHWPLLALLASAAMLAGAHAFEAAGYRPCSLCLRQREVYWAAIAIAAAALVATRFWKGPFLPRGANALIGGAFLVGASVAVYHAGVEWKFWPGPTTCQTVTSGALTVDDITAALGGAVKAVPCDEAAWRDPITGLSMAGWNALVSFALAGFSLFAAAAPVTRTDHD
ncbi:MAG: disulfide bond formation protein B [Hyphomonadaceae bacterium]|nr:disulfide bond formation protein B [Hyphomonadaceae bacterium]